MTALDAVLPDGADIVADAGNTGAAVIHHLPVPEDGRFVVALGMGGMGYAFGAGIGSALGRGRRTYVVAGDGSVLHARIRGTHRRGIPGCRSRSSSSTTTRTRCV